MRTKHLDRYPLAPSTDAQNCDRYTLCALEHMYRGLSYWTGPRRGQQLAAWRKRMAVLEGK